MATGIVEGTALVIASSGAITGQAILSVTPATLISIAVTPASASIAAGLTAQFAAAGTFTDGSTRTLTGEVAWSMDASSVATVSATGLTTGIGEGTALVIASSGTVTAQAVLTVTPATLSSLAVTPTSASVPAGQAAQFAAAGTFTNGSTRTLTGEVLWSTDVSSVATVDASGLVTGAGAGTALVIASSGAVTAQASLTVNATYFVTASADGAASLSSSRADMAITAVSPGSAASAYAAAAGQGLVLMMPSYYELQPSPVVFDPAALLSFSFDPASVDTRTISIYRYNGPEWSSAPVAGQSLEILGPSSARASGYLSSASLYAVFSLPPAPSLTSITVTPSTASIMTGETAQFVAAGTFSDASTRTMTGEVLWSTDVSSVAMVSASGLATGAGAGAARVIATSGTITGYASLTVTLPPLTLASITPSSATVGQVISASLTGTGFDAATALTLERADALSGTWAATGGFAQGRYLGTLTKLGDGRVLLAGGVGGPTAADIYNPATGAWTAASPLNQGRDQHAAVALVDGRVLVAGGYAGGSPISSSEIYDPALNTWTAAAPMNSVRAWHQMTRLADGRVLAAGGINGTGYVSSAEIYDPAADTWTPAAPMSVSHAGAAMTALSGGKILVAGGFGGNLTGEVYDPAANVWTTATGALQASGYFLQAATLADGKVVIAGDPGGTTDLYDPATNALTPAASLVVARYVHAMVRVGGTALVIGGENSTALASTEVYDAAAGAWRPGPALTAPRTWLRGAVLEDGRVLVAGGLASVGGTRLNTAELLGAAAVSIAATDETAADSQHLGGNLDLAGAATGYWDVVVRRTDGQAARLNGGFRVLTAPAPALASIAVTPSSTSIAAGTTAQFAAAGTFTDGSTRTLTGEVVWSTDASSVAAVSASGLATGEGEGTARVIASSGAIAASAVLTVTPPTLVSIAVTPSTASILTGESAQFSASGTFTDGSTRTMTSEVLWSTDASSVATVSASGLATGAGAGAARVITTSGTITGYASLTVTLPPLTLASISPSSATAGHSISATVTGTGFDASAALALERADALRGTWAVTGSFAEARYLGTLTKLGDGRALLAGGSGDSTAADLYNPATGAWTAAQPLHQGRDQHAAVALADGRVLVSGGYAAGAPVNTAEIYDPALNTWTTAAPMGSVRAWHHQALLPDGRVLAAGGIDGPGYTNSAEIYDPAANSWSPAAPMAQGHAGAAMAALGGGKILIAGGFGGNLTGEVYNPAANAWTTATGALQASGYFLQAAALADGKIMIAGDPGGTTDTYDPATNALATAASLGTARYVHAMVSAGGTVAVIGGENSTALASTEVYDAAAGAWRPGPALTSPRSWPRAVVLDDGRVLAAGGRDAGGTNLNTAEVLGAPATSIAATGASAADAQHLTGTFDLAGAATGYWDVVVRRTDGQSARLDDGFEVLAVPAPTLASIAVTPSSASITAGSTIQFAAAGTFTDGSTRTMTGEVTWSTDASSVATVSASGLATGVAGGGAIVTASAGAMSGQGILNVAFVATSTGTVGGSPEVTLVSTAPFSVVLASTETGAGALALGSATAQGLLLVSPVYEVTREDAGATAVLTWSFDPALVDTATLAIWRFDGAAWSSATVLNQVVNVTDGVGTVTGEVVLTSLFGLFVQDFAPPVTTLLIDGLPAGTTSLTIAPTSVLGFAAVDAGAGMIETHYALDGGAETVFVSTFSLTPGTHALSYRSVDRAGNEEAARGAAIIVTNPSADTQPPLVRFDYPDASALGVEQALGGVVDVRGAISDASALTWTLEAAPGASATGGFTAIASGAGNLSGLITAWNTASLSGYQTLRLRATDAFGNTASMTATVFIGAPVMTFAIGRKNSDAIVSALKGPTGIAVRSDGAIWVASTENDKILLISPAGVLLGAAGNAQGHSEERGKKDKKGKDHDDEDETEGSAAPSFKTPQGMALDAAGNLYVADRDMNRVVKLSADGQALLLQFGRPGAGPGELRRPFDVAVDANGDVYAADTGNRRVSVFDASGAFLRQFGQDVLLSTSQIRGLALTSEGLWVSDKELEVIHLFSRTGTLIKTIGGSDSAVGELSRMRGLASDRLGALYVVEPNRDRVQKFDPRGKGLLAFGSRDGLSRADRVAKRWLTQPIDAAVAPDGSIWVTDTGRDRIVRYALPSAGGGVAALSTGGGEFSSSAAEPARRVVDHKDGAAVARDDGSGVRVPKGALAADLEITVEKGDENVDKEPKEAKRRGLKITAVSEEIQYGPEGTTFNAPVTLTLPYDANLLASLGLNEDGLKVYYWNPTLQEWQAMPSTVDKKAKTVNAVTTHFSAYQVGALGGIGAAAVDDFGLRDGYAFPNPSRNGSAVTFRMQPGSADSIEVRVYDLSGRKVHSSADFRFLGAVDDGNGKGAQNTYDHVWNVSGIGSGVYTFVMTARKSGQPDVRKTGKVGVIK
jgi:sugar lactone lactonase YvrE